MNISDIPDFGPIAIMFCEEDSDINLEIDYPFFTIDVHSNKNVSKSFKLAKIPCWIVFMDGNEVRRTYDEPNGKFFEI